MIVLYEDLCILIFMYRLLLEKMFGVYIGDIVNFDNFIRI